MVRLSGELRAYFCLVLVRLGGVDMTKAKPQNTQRHFGLVSTDLARGSGSLAQGLMWSFGFRASKVHGL